jgi:hypothetical protein
MNMKEEKFIDFPWINYLDQNWEVAWGSGISSYLIKLCSLGKIGDFCPALTAYVQKCWKQNIFCLEIPYALASWKFHWLKRDRRGLV